MIAVIYFKFQTSDFKLPPSLASLHGAAGAVQSERCGTFIGHDDAIVAWQTMEIPRYGCRGTRHGMTVGCGSRGNRRAMTWGVVAAAPAWNDGGVWLPRHPAWNDGGVW